MDRLDGDEEGTIGRGAQPVVPPPMASYLCAICLHNHLPATVATTMINGTTVCSEHATKAPRSSMPMGE